MRTCFEVWRYDFSTVQDIPICAVFKAMGIESDQEIVQMIGIEEEVLNYFAATIEEGNMLQIYTRNQVQFFMFGIILKILNILMNMYFLCSCYSTISWEFQFFFYLILFGISIIFQIVWWKRILGFFIVIFFKFSRYFDVVFHICLKIFKCKLSKIFLKINVRIKKLIRNVGVFQLFELLDLHFRLWNICLQNSNTNNCGHARCLS